MTAAPSLIVVRVTWIMKQLGILRNVNCPQWKLNIYFLVSDFFTINRLNSKYIRSTCYGHGIEYAFSDELFHVTLSRTLWEGKISPSLEAGRSETWNDQLASQDHLVGPKFRTLFTGSPRNTTWALGPHSFSFPAGLLAQPATGTLLLSLWKPQTVCAPVLKG